MPPRPAQRRVRPTTVWRGPGRRGRRGGDGGAAGPASGLSDGRLRSRSLNDRRHRGCRDRRGSRGRRCDRRRSRRGGRFSGGLRGGGGLGGSLARGGFSGASLGFVGGALRRLTVLVLASRLDGALAGAHLVLRQTASRIAATRRLGRTRLVGRPALGRGRRGQVTGRRGVRTCPLGFDHYRLGAAVAEALLHHAGAHRALAGLQCDGRAPTWGAGPTVIVLVAHALACTSARQGLAKNRSFHVRKGPGRTPTKEARFPTLHSRAQPEGLRSTSKILEPCDQTGHAGSIERP